MFHDLLPHISSEETRLVLVGLTCTVAGLLVA